MTNLPKNRKLAISQNSNFYFTGKPCKHGHILKRRTARDAKRRAAKLNRTPSWLTSDDENIIKDMYTIAKRVSKEMGIEHHIDHVIPLQGKLISGLHVPNNLQLLTANSNLSKGNHFAVN